MDALQGELFAAATPDEGVGYRGPVACRAAGITYRQLDYWDRTSLVHPSLRSANGSGSQRLYSFTDILLLRVVKRLIDTGVSLPNIRAAVVFLQGSELPLSQVTLVSDGATVFACTEEDEVIDLLRNGQGVFGIGISSVHQQVDATLAQLPAERLADAEPVTNPLVVDELAARREVRKAS